MISWHEAVRLARGSLSRRRFLHTVSASTAVAGTLGWRDLMSVQAEELRRQHRAMILLWMQGGPSQMETFDPKPGHANGGPTKAIETAVTGIQIAESWPQTAKVMRDLALIRSLTNKEGNHQRATYQLRTGYVPAGSVKHPSLGANVASRIGDPESELPAVVSVGQTLGAGFLGVDYEPFVVQEPGEMPRNVDTPVSRSRFGRRLRLLGELEEEFAGRGAEQLVENHRKLYGKAAGLVRSDRRKAFDISDEPESLKTQYGDSDFGRGCLLARRLVEAGVPFVEIQLNGWDTHADNFARTTELAGQADPALATLISDLRERGMLERTLVVWMGEFGRTPRVNARTGRDHFPRVFNAALAGCGIRGGQVIGASAEDGMSVAERSVTVPDLFCTFCEALQIDPRSEEISPLGRPMKIVEGGQSVRELFG